MVVRPSPSDRRDRVSYLAADPETAGIGTTDLQRRNSNRRCAVISGPSEPVPSVRFRPLAHHEQALAIRAVSLHLLPAVSLAPTRHRWGLPRRLRSRTDPWPRTRPPLRNPRRSQAFAKPPIRLDPY